MNTKNFYFTYGTSGQPFVGGWTRVEAYDRESAVAIFRSIHPDVHKGIVNCASVYDEEQFQKTWTYANGNYGKREVEVVLMHHIVIDGGASHE